MLALACALSDARAQPAFQNSYSTTPFRAAEGLPSQAVTDLATTSDGYLWVIAGGVLARFDGVVFRSYGAQTSPLLARRVSTLHAGRGDTLWVVDDHNAVLAIVRGVVSEVVPPSLRGIRSIVQSGSGRLFAIADSAWPLQRAAAAPQPSTVLDDDDTTEGFFWWRDRLGTTWLQDPVGGWVRPLVGGPVDVRLAVRPMLVPAPSRRVVYEARARGRTIHVLDSAGHTLFAYPQVPGSAARLIDRENRLWVTTPIGTDIYVAGSDVPAVRVRTLPESRSLHLLEGPDGCIWSARDFLFRTCRTAFQTWRRDSMHAVPDLQAVRGAGDGVLLIDVAGTIDSVTEAGRRLMRPRPPNPYIAVAAHVDPRGTMWLTDGAAVRGTRSDGGQIVLPYSTVTRFASHESRADELWYADATHFYRAAPYARGGPRVIDSVPHHVTVLAMAVSRAGVLWAVLRDSDQTTRVLRVEAGRATVLDESQSLPRPPLRTLIADDDGTVWLGAYGGGLIRLRDGRFRTVLQSDGLAEDVVTSVLADDAGNLWMGGNRSIHRVPRQQVEDFLDGRAPRVFGTAYTTSHGIDDPETSGAAGVRDASGRLWFPTMNGTVVVHPALAVQLDSGSATVNVLAIRTDRDSIIVDPWETAANTTAQLTRGVRRLAFMYTAVSLRNPTGIHYQYRVDGIDEQWVDAGPSRVATYNSIGPGTYTFHVRTIGSEGNPGAREGQVMFTVPAYAYETPAFAMLMLAALGALGFLGVELRVRRLRLREAELTRQVERRTQSLAVALRTAADQSDALRTLDEAKSRFFANVSHEFRTPLSLILGPAHDLHDGRGGDLPIAARHLIETITTNATRLLHLVEQLLDLARLESATMPMRAEVQDLLPLVRRLADSFSSMAEQRGIDFQLSHPVGALRVRFDSGQMETIIGNLVGNALKFTPRGGTVALRCNVEMRETATAVIEVRDSGPGIALAHQSRVFERFYQVDDSTQRAHEGLGIGLALAKELVERHGGVITLDSVEGAGCAFVVRLPLANATPTSVERAVTMDIDGIIDHSCRSGPLSVPREEAPQLSEDVVTVLVVEDNVELLEFLRGHLAQRYRVLTALDGLLGLALARQYVPDLIISDVMMPMMDGFSLCEAVRHDPDIDFVPVILLTARASRNSRLEGLTGGADDYLTKPVDMIELVIRADNLIQSRRRVRERYRAEHRDLPGVEPPEIPSPPDTPDGELVRQFYAIIADHLGDESFNVEAMASALGTSRASFYRKLGKALGKSPVDALWDYRLVQAAQWLADTPIKISEVAYGVGFKSVPHFCSRFRARFGETPSAYRRTRQ